MSLGSYFFIWLIIEATVFLTLPLIVMDRPRPNVNTESVIIYFVYQAVARILILCGVMQHIRDMPSLLLISGIMVKLGVVPFHVWVLPVFKGCRLPVFFLLLVPVKLPVYVLRDFWVEDFLPVVLLRTVVGILLAINQSSLLSLIAASRIASTGILLICLKMEMFNRYFAGYASSVGCILYGLNWREGLMLSCGILSLVGLPFLPIFLPKLSLLLFRLSTAPYVAFLILLRFITSSIYYVKFLPLSAINLTLRGLTCVGGLVIISIISIV